MSVNSDDRQLSCTNVSRLSLNLNMSRIDRQELSGFLFDDLFNYA